MKLFAVGVSTPVSDYLINVSEMPGPNGHARMLAESYQFGGKVASAMAALGRLGVPCAMAGNLGDDLDGLSQIDDFQFNGVDTSHLRLDPDYQTSYCVVISDRKTGGRAIIGSPRKTRRVEPSDLDEAFIKSASYVHLDGANEATRLAAKWIHEVGGQVTFDGDGYTPQVEEMLPEIDVFIPSEFYYNTRYGKDTDPMDAARQMAAMGPHTVVITLGEKGCVGVSPDGEFTLPAFKVDVVDSTGAGDVFHGGYLYGLYKGWKASECARWASAVAAIKCTSMGGRAALPTVDMVNKFIEDGTVDQEIIAARVSRYSQQPYSRVKR